MMFHCCDTNSQSLNNKDVYRTVQTILGLLNILFFLITTQSSLTSGSDLVNNSLILLAILTYLT